MYSFTALIFNLNSYKPEMLAISVEPTLKQEAGSLTLKPGRRPEKWADKRTTQTSHLPD